MSTVVIARTLPDGATDELVAAGHRLVAPGSGGAPVFDRAALEAALADADALVCPLTVRVDRSLLAAGPNLEVVANVAVGYDNIDVAAATEAGIVVCNTPGILDETTADLAFALMLAACRLLPTAEAELRAGRWPGWDLDQFLGQDVHGARLGLVGYGRIARAVAARAAGFGMDVRHHSRTDTGEPGWVADLDELLATSDIVSLHVPLSDATHHLVDARRLALMKPTAVLVNTARGPVVDEAALADALHRGALFAAGLDVYEHEPKIDDALLTAPRVVLLPHIGSASFATRRRMAALACAGAAAVLAGRVPDNAVNPPS